MVTKNKTIQRQKRATDNSVNQTVKISIQIGDSHLGKSKKKVRNTNTKKLRRF